MERLKPGYRITAAVIAACIVAAVCSFTRGVTLSRFNAEMDVSARLEDVRELTLRSEDMSVTYTDADTVLRVTERLNRIRVSRAPVSQNRSADREKAYCVIVHGDTELCFNRYFTEYWIDNHVKPTLSYRIKNPEKARMLAAEFGLSSNSDRGSRINKRPFHGMDV